MPNEIIYEIFEFLDICHIYVSFFNLNQRFQNFLTDSTFPIKINLSSISRSTFEDHYKYIIMSNKHRISSLYLSNRFTIDLIFTSIRTVSKLIYLQTLNISNMQSKYIDKLLKYLRSLPRLASLGIIVLDPIENKNKLYHRIFRLPVLKYCKIKLSKLIESEPLSIAMVDEYSPIEHLVIHNGCQLHELVSLLSYVPQLRRLSLHDLYGVLIESYPVQLNSLTHVTIHKTNMEFDEFELLVRNYFQQIQVLHFSRNFDEQFLNANRWERLIVSHMPQLRIFDFHCTMSAFDQNKFDNLINHFHSPFWLERQWFFAHGSTSTGDRLTIFSTNPYRFHFTITISLSIFLFFRRKSYTIHRENGYTYGSQINLNTVHFVCIEDIESLNDCNNYFPNSTELTLSFKSINKNRNNLSIMLNRILPLKQLTKLVFDIYHYQFKILFELLQCASNVQTLTLNCTSLCESSFILIQQYETFQLVSRTNKIINLIITTECTLEVTKLLVNLCPQLQHLTINISKNHFVATLRFLLSKSVRHLFSLCIQHVSEDEMLILNELTKPEKLSNHYFMKVSGVSQDTVYLWW